MSRIRNRKPTATEAPSTVAAGKTVSDSGLYFYDQLDDWQKDNHYILSGYVKETKSFADCIKSLTYLHNETVNIYSHLLPSLLIVLLVTYFLMFNIKLYPTNLGWENYNFLQFAIACTYCLGTSASFHTIKSHSVSVCKKGNQLDYFGIIVLITSSLISIVLFAFYDDNVWKFIFIITFLVLGTICTVLTLDSKFATPEYRPLRSLMFIIFGLSGGFPVIIAIREYGYQLAVERSNAPWLILEGAFYIGGAVLYALRFPESCEIKKSKREGLFDIWGSSHQIFHFMVVIAAYCHWRALVGCYEHLHEVTLA